MIEVIDAYFKLWNYFLFRPEVKQADSILTSVHIASVERLKGVVRVIIGCARSLTDVHSPMTFFSNLQKLDLHKTDVEQCVLEMLLAGTDTSSVTLYYSILGLADREQSDFQSHLHNELMHECCSQINFWYRHLAVCVVYLHPKPSAQKQATQNTPPSPLTQTRTHAHKVMIRGHDQGQSCITLVALSAVLVLQAVGASTPLLTNLINESMRVKPVGPIIIRQVCAH